MPVPTLSVLYSDNHLLVIDKPAGIATMGSPQEAQTIARLAALYLQRKYNKPGKLSLSRQPTRPTRLRRIDTSSDQQSGQSYLRAIATTACREILRGNR
ncbi:MAG: hypothetical protein R3C56_25815 [Pirellulaceae bacterium]